MSTSPADSTREATPESDKQQFEMPDPALRPGAAEYLARCR